MRDYPQDAVERAMKIQEIILRAIAKKILWLEAAQIIGVSPRHMRRWHHWDDDDPEGERLKKLGEVALRISRKSVGSPLVQGARRGCQLKAYQSYSITLLTSSETLGGGAGGFAGCQ